MRIIPVIDLKGGVAVHAVAGDRAHYGPVQSRLHAGADPLRLAEAFREVLGLAELYLADLDAIAGASPAVDLFRAMVDDGLSLCVDAGVRGRSSLRSLLAAGVETIVIGSESVAGPVASGEVIAEAGPERVVFSLDLRDGDLVTAPGADWGTRDPIRVVETVAGLGFRRVLLLDLARVGTARGTGTVRLLERLRDHHPTLEINVGGGIAGLDDLKALARSGASGVLVGSALHDGRIGAEEMARLREDRAVQGDCSGPR